MIICLVWDELFQQTDGRTDRQNGPNSRFRYFANAPNNDITTVDFSRKTGYVAVGYKRALINKLRAL
jgi:hypothetical protein